MEATVKYYGIKGGGSFITSSYREYISGMPKFAGEFRRLKVNDPREAVAAIIEEELGKIEVNSNYHVALETYECSSPWEKRYSVYKWAVFEDDPNHWWR